MHTDSKELFFFLDEKILRKSVWVGELILNDNLNIPKRQI